MIEWNLAEANPIREKLIKATIKTLMKELQAIDDSHLVKAKNPQIFTKVMLELSETCEVCDKKYTKHSIVDMFNLDAKGNLLDRTTTIACKACATKVKAKI